MTHRLIESWLPIAALGEESVRERRSMTALPPTYYLHVWWARRPLVASRAAILASLLPADTDRDQFMQVLGIHGDPVASKKRIDAAKRKGAFHRMHSAWPPRLLIADEVGLGKTIEAGLLLRQAWLSGRARRILVLAPKAVLTQWQIELREKFNLDWPIYDGDSLVWQATPAHREGIVRQVSRQTWHKEPFVIASSHLMRPFAVVLACSLASSVSSSPSCHACRIVSPKRR